MHHGAPYLTPCSENSGPVPRRKTQRVSARHTKTLVGMRNVTARQQVGPRWLRPRRAPPCAAVCRRMRLRLTFHCLKANRQFRHVFSSILWASDNSGR